MAQEVAVSWSMWWWDSLYSLGDNMIGDAAADLADVLKLCSGLDFFS